MRTYDPTKVSVVFAGNIIDGYATDSFIKAARKEEAWKLKIGLSGTGARARNPNKSGAIEITLLTSSPANAVLSTIMLNDELQASGVGEIAIRDRTSNDALVTARNAWILKPPDFERAAEIGEITWVLETENIVIFHDGTIDQ